MPESFISLDSWGSEDEFFLPLDSFTQTQATPFTSLTSFESDLEERFRFQQKGEDLRLYGERGTPVRPAGLLEQFARGLVRDASLGLSKFAIKEKQPENIGEDISRAVGSFIGFVGVPIKIGAKVASWAVFGVGKVIAKKGIKHVAQYATKGITTLAVAEVASDITNVSEAPERFVSGATIGAIFGATHGLHIKDNPLLSNIARQFMGRALLGVAGRYDENTLKKENVGNLVFSELLHTFFFSRGITKAQILSGDINPKRWRDVDTVQKAIDSVNKKIPRPFLKPEEVAELPNVIKAMAKLDGDRVTIEAIDAVERITDIRYDIKKGTITPFVKPGKSPETKANELWFTRNPKTGELILKFRGAVVEGDKEAIREISDSVRIEVDKIVKFPTMQLEKSAAGRKILDWTHESLVARPDMPFRNSNTLFRMFSEFPIDQKGVPKPRWIDLKRLQNFFDEVDKAPLGQAPRVMHDLITQKTPEPLRSPEWDNPKFKELYDKEVEYQGALSYKAIKKEWDAIAAGKKTGSPLIHLSKPSWAKPFWDLRKYIQHLQRVTGLPWWTIGKKVITGTGLREMATQELLNPFQKFGHLAEEEGKRISSYYDVRDSMWTQYKNKGIPLKKFEEDTKPLRNKLTDRENTYVNLIDEVMVKIAPDIKLSRFQNWMAAKEEQLMHPERGKTSDIFKKQKELEPTLEQIYLDYKKQPKERQGQWLVEELKKHNFGIIQAGNYLPGMLSGQFKLIEAGVRDDFISAISDMGKTHFKIRTTEKGEISKRAMEEMVIESHFHKDLPNRIETYIRHIYNDKYLRQPFKELEKLTDTFRVHLEQTQPEAFLKKGAEAKAYSLLNYVDTWTHRAKGYPVKIGKFGHFAKWTQSLFFRSLVVRPRLPLRNLFQGALTGVTISDKRILNPKWWGKFKSLPQEVQEKFFAHVDQRPSYKKHYLFMEETDKFKDSPKFGWYWKAAEKVGSIYPWTDFLNRSTTFTRTYKRDTFFINRYRKGEITEKQLYEKLALNKMDGLERMDILQLFDKGADVEAKVYHAKWMVDNSQWLYKRDEKSFFEMTGEGEAFTNLLTWTKGILQHTIEVGTRFQEGMERGNKKAVLSSTTQIMGLLFVGQVANYALQHLTFRHGSSYTDYGIDMYIWEVGGVSVDLIQSTIGATAQLLTSLDGLPEEKKRARENFLRVVDNEGIRQLLPFTKTILSVIEAVAGKSYVSPIYNALTKKGLDRVDRTLIERLSHAIWSTDPTKSKQTYQWATEQEEKYHQAYLKSTNAISREKNRLLYMRYKFLSELFGRYQPIEVYKYYERGEEDKIMMKFEPDYYLKEEAAEKRKATQEARRWQHGYY